VFYSQQNKKQESCTLKNNGPTKIPDDPLGERKGFLEHNEKKTKEVRK